MSFKYSNVELELLNEPLRARKGRFLSVEHFLGLELGSEAGLGKILKGTMLSGKTEGLEMS